MRLWLVGVGISLLGVMACSDDGERGEPLGQAGDAGRATSDVPVGASGGEGGTAPVAACNDGLQRLRVVSDVGGVLDSDIGGDDPASIAAMVAFDEAERVAVNLIDSIGIFDLSLAGVEGSVHLVERLTLEDAGLPAEGAFIDLFRVGDGLLIYARRGQAADNDVFLAWHPAAGFEWLTTAPSEVGYLTGQIADEEHGIVIGTDQGIFRAESVAGEWSWGSVGVAGRRAAPLAFDGDELLVGVAEVYEGFGESGAGGAGGASGTLPARVERWSLSGELLASHETLGNPSAAVPARGGFLITQTNSFWGTYRAAVDWLDPEGELVRLAEVPVASSGDGTDGAYDAATYGDDLLVANCESGLRRGSWVTGEPVSLSEVSGPWSPEFATCHPSELEIVDDVLVVGGERLDFVRFCD